MAVAPDSNSTAWAVATATSVSDATNTVGASASILLAFVSASATAQPAGTSVVWDSGGGNQTMTQVAGTAIGATHGPKWQAIYALVNPTSGAKTCKFSVTSSTELHLITQSFTGSVTSSVAAATANGITSSNTSSTPATVTITSATGDFTVSIASQDTGFWSGGTNNKTQIDSYDTSGGIFESLAQRATGAASVTHSATISGGGAMDWIASGCDIVALVSAAEVGRKQGVLFTPGRGPSKSLRSLKAYPNPIIVPTLDIPRRRFIHR